MGEINHVGIILDGNRRYAKALGLPPNEGHVKGSENINTLIKWAGGLKGEEKQKYDFNELSLYVFSMQNFRRTEFEKALLMNLFEKAFLELAESDDVKKAGIQVNFCGRLHLLPGKVQSAIKKAHEATKHNKDKKLNFCIAYGGREEIIDGVNRLIKEGRTEPVSEEEFSGYLYGFTEPELIIRTGMKEGCRTSNFLLWHSTYSEWFFLDKTWPEFSPEDFKGIIDEYQLRNRRFGR
jgi:undecaprenyl diphosphate synthase